MNLVLSPIRIRPVFLFLALLAACGDGGVSSLTQPITDGAEDNGHASVGYLAAGDGVGCTGTVVGRRTVLTAAHCISGGPQTFVLDGFAYLTRSSTVHPKYDAVSHDNDIGLLQLQREVHAVPSRLEPKSRPATTSVTMVGFGATSEGGSDSGTKRKAANTIASLHTTSFNIAGTGGGEGNVCHHDSGAPVFVGTSAGEAQLGVVIGGVAPCGTTGIAMRIDIYLAWLRATASGDMAVAGEAGAKFGLPCANGQECASGQCLEDQATGDKFCSLTCAGPGASCPEGGACAATVIGGENLCQLPLAPEAEEGGCTVGQGGAQGGGARVGATGCLFMLLLVAATVGSRRRARRR